MDSHIPLFVCCLIALFSAGLAAIPLDIDESPLDNNVTAPPPNYRLNDDVEPISYTLTVRPYFEHADAAKAFTFDGEAEIKIKATRSGVQVITLHKKDLNVTSQKIDLFGWGLGAPKIVSTSYDNVTDKYSLTLDRPLNKWFEYTLKFVYVGRLQSDMHGFYSSSYQVDNATKWLASTQFEPVHARKAFPCFDEPRFKAVIQLSIDRPRHFQPSLANTKIRTVREVTVNGEVFMRETFHDTPKMSTYLVAFIVSEFVCRENNEKTFQVCARPNAYELTEYAFEVGQKLLAQLDQLFGKPYAQHGLGKLTMAAIPDFSAGAMENWGLLTYRESALLYDPKNPSKVSKNRIASVITHEQAHLWFGDLVTCNWWEHTWLNEGFARFFQYFVTAVIESDFQLNEAFVTEQIHTAFGFDAIADTHALSQEVNSPAEISVMFDQITYNKGASVIRMLQHVLGNNTFVSGLRTYLNDRAYNTAVPSDLYKALATNGVNVDKFMNTWIQQKGFPYVTVEVDANRTSANVTQRRYFLKEGDANDETQWEVPLTWAHANANANFTDTTVGAFLSDNASLPIAFGGNVSWVIFNVQQTGFYRVKYDAVTLGHIINTLKKNEKEIHVLNRAQIVDDALAFARSGHSTFAIAFRVLDYLKYEIDPLPWFSALNHLNYLHSRYAPDQDANIKNHVAGLIGHVYHYAVKYNESADGYEPIVYNAKTIAYHACQFGLEECVNDAKVSFGEFLNGNHSIPSDLRLAYYCTGIQHDSAEGWQKLWNAYEQENLANEQAIILSALGCTPNHDLVTKYLDLILSDKVRLQDKRTAFLATLRARGNVDHVFNYILKNRDNITAAFESDSDVPSLLSSVAGYFTNDGQLKRLEEFGASLNGSKPIENAIKNVKYNLRWAKLYVPAVEKILAPHVPQPGKPEKPTGDGSGAGTITLSLLTVAIACLSFIHSL